jgi:Ca2+-binding EF-hand superfamily protein
MPNYGKAARVDDGAEVIAPWMSSSDTAFWNLDRDGDGSLVQAEFVASRGNDKAVKKATDLFAILDADHDGKLTLQEFTKRPPQARFCEYDVDGDGRLSVKEFQAVELPGASESRAQRMLSALDRDGDGKLSLEEFQRRQDVAKAVFQRRDLDEDGRLSLEELVKGGPEMAKNGTGAQALAAMDANHDGVLEEKEYSLQIESFFVRDKNADGKLDGTEYLFYSRTPEAVARAKKEFAQRDADGDGQVTFAEFMAPPAAVDRSPEAVFRGRDTNRDGRLSLEEYLAGQKDGSLERDVFRLLDANEDGALTFEEWRSNPPRAVFRRADVDGDGRLSVKEFQAVELPGASAARAQRMLSALDRDGDGKLSVEEFQRRQDVAKAVFQRRDLDEDGRLSLEELVKGGPEMAKNGTGAQALAAMDANHDGVLEEKEYSLQIESFFVRDKNADGKLDGTEYLFYSRTPEAVARAKKEFAQRDRDGDGQVTFAEFMAPPAAVDRSPEAVFRGRDANK